MATFMTNHLRRARGFSLLELMVAVSISAILTIMAVSSYQTSVLQSHRTDAKTAHPRMYGDVQDMAFVGNQPSA